MRTGSHADWNLSNQPLIVDAPYLVMKKGFGIAGQVVLMPLQSGEELQHY